MDQSDFQDVVAEMERHPECDRIKKLIHWVCTQTWCQEPQTLEIAPLLMGLVARASTPETLHTLLLDGAATLNKRQKYAQIGHMIVQILTPVYASMLTSASPTPKPQAQPASPLQSGAQGGADYDRFEVRLAVIKYTTPLKAKILIKALLDDQVLLQPKHWFLLRQSSLDELLHRLYQECPNWTTLEQNLMQVAAELATIDQIGQTVQAVRQALRPLYPAPSDPIPQPASAVDSPVSRAAEWSSEDLEEMTSVILPPAEAGISSQVGNNSHRYSERGIG